MKKFMYYLGAFLLIVNMKVFSQEIEDISPDRPDQTESPDILEKNYVQFETGLFFERDYSEHGFKSTNYSLPEMLIRYGLLNIIELRFNLNYVREDISSIFSVENYSGLKPLGIGAKLKLFDGKNILPKTAILMNIDLPGIGNKRYRIKHISPEINILMNNEISNKIDLGYNAGIIWDNDEKITKEFYTVSLGVTPFNRFTFFLESYGFFNNSSSPDLRADYGISYTLLKNFQIDISSGIGISKISPDYFIDLGFSVRFPN